MGRSGGDRFTDWLKDGAILARLSAAARRLSRRRRVADPSISTDDICNEAVVRARLNANQFKSERPTEFISWVSVIMRNWVEEVGRRRANVSAGQLFDPVTLAAPGQVGAHGGQGDEPTLFDLAEAVENLKPRLKQVYELIYEKGMTKQQAAEKLGISIGVFRGLEDKMREALGDFLRRN